MAVIGFVIATSTTLGAQVGTISSPERAKPALRFNEAWPAAPGTRETMIIGVVLDIAQVPVPDAIVRLRDIASGNVVQESQANDHGEYRFVVAEPGTYVVEMVLPNGHVAALSNVATLDRFETLQTIVRLPGLWNGVDRTVGAPYRTGDIFGASGARTLTADTLAIAVQRNISAFDAGEPVSP
jgi:protocatechuate 3,4-dioxygenase beta subunit